MDNKQNQAKEIDIREGTMEFWVREDKVRWNDNKSNVLFNITVNNTGSLFMIKDDDNKLKFFHLIIGKGKTDLEVDVSNLSLDKPHHIAVKWSVSKKEVGLYVDGKLEDKKEITYSL